MEIDIYQGIRKVERNVIKNVLSHKKSSVDNEKTVFLYILKSNVSFCKVRKININIFGNTQVSSRLLRSSVLNNPSA